MCLFRMITLLFWFSLFLDKQITNQNKHRDDLDLEGIKTIPIKIKRGLRMYICFLTLGRQDRSWTCWKIWDQTLGPNFLWTPLKLWVQTKKRQTMQIEVHLVVRKMAQPLESDHCEEGMDKARGRNNIWSTSTARKQVDHYCGGPAGKNRQLDQEPLLFDDKAVFKANE